jgi:SAM-dependent methyltransferase
MHEDMASFYNERYRNTNYFRYRTWLYRSYVSSLIAFCRLKSGDTLLDVGCGQGIFSYLFSKHGIKVHGIDISETGIEAAKSLYGRFGITFAVDDIRTATFPRQFDCIFARSCSLYNSDAFLIQKGATHEFLKHLKTKGTFIFAYNSKLSSKISQTWRYHSLEDLKQHFSDYPCAKAFFLDRITPLFLRRYSLTAFATRLSILLSKASGTGGDLICILQEPQRRESHVSGISCP